MRGDFLVYFRKMCRKKYEKWDTVYRHFCNFTDGHCTFGDITIELCKGFGEYLLGAHQLRLTHRKISRNSAAGYFSTFRGLLKTAYRDKLIRENVNDFLDKIETEDVKKNYLTLDELKRLAATPCPIDVLKRASLFSCLTGLRISDVLKLKWEDFEIAPDMGYCIRIRTQKTQTEAMLPVSQEALELCGEQSSGTVFKGLTRSMINYPLKKWIAAAGIKKSITFHSSNHKCIKHFYLNEICAKYRFLFSKPVSYNRFTELEKSVVVQFVIFVKKCLLGKCTGISFVDSTLLRVCRNQRMHMHKVFKGIAQRGKCSLGWFYGFKLHLICNDKGEILNFMITPGDVDDREPLKMKSFVEFIYGKLVGDKGYISQNFFNKLFIDGIQLITKLKSSMRSALRSMYNRILLRKRAIIETINDELKNITQIEHP